MSMNAPNHPSEVRALLFYVWCGIKWCGGVRCGAVWCGVRWDAALCRVMRVAWWCVCCVGTCPLFNAAFAGALRLRCGSCQGIYDPASTHYGLEPAVEYLLRVNWRDGERYSVFKLKILTQALNRMLQTLDLPRSGDIAIVNSDGEVVAYPDASIQVSRLVPNSSWCGGGKVVPAA